VSDIKDNAVALWNRPLVEEIIADHIKERVALAASMEETIREFAAGLGDSLGGEHPGLQFVCRRKRCRFVRASLCDSASLAKGQRTYDCRTMITAQVSRV
jgi:hypothetical protein